MNYKAVWKPLPGSQSLSLSCPCNEILYEGTRGPGKTAAQLARFRRLVGLGYGSFWRGVIFDTEYKNLTDIITQSKRMYRLFNDGARYLASASELRWVWPTGEELLFRFGKEEGDYQMDLFSSIIPKQILKHVPLQSIAPEQVYAAAVAQPFQGRLLKEWGQKLEADRLDKITNAVRTGFLQGETVEQIVRRVAGTPKLNREDGVINASRRDLAVVTRTAVNHMAATARQEFAQANSDIVKAKQWSSTLDTHTSQWCIIRDRKLYALDGKPLGHVVPYLRGPGKIHFCCRSGEILITKSWEELQISSGELSSATRASMDGQVPTHTNYADWLTRQPYARQEQVLGVTRGMMLRDGKITVPEMFNDAGEFLTLDELRRVDASAFE